MRDGSAEGYDRSNRGPRTAMARRNAVLRFISSAEKSNAGTTGINFDRPQTARLQSDLSDGKDLRLFATRVTSRCRLQEHSLCSRGSAKGGGGHPTTPRRFHRNVLSRKQRRGRSGGCRMAVGQRRDSARKTISILGIV